MSLDHPTELRPRRRRNRVLIAVGLSVFIVGAAVLSIFFVRPFLHWKNAQSWSSTEAQILSSEIETSLAKQSASYEAKFDYSFEVDGECWNGSQYGFFVFSGSQNGAEELVKQYPVGATTKVFYNPYKPSDAVINRSLGPAVWFGIGPIAMTVIGLGVFWLGFRGRLSMPNPE